MNLKIDRDELPELIEETARLEEEDQALLETKEARQILRELDLPDTRVDEARRVIAEKKEERRVSRRRRLLGAAVAVAVLLGAGSVAYSRHLRSDALGRLEVAQSALKVGDEPVPTVLLRAARPEMVLDLVLANPPQGSALPLTCAWSAPDGSVRYQNRWETKTIDRDRWPTRCRHTFGVSDTPGRWSVTMKQGERPLSTESFVLE